MLYLVNFLCTNIPFTPQQKQEFLDIPTVKERAFALYAALRKEAQLLEIKADIAIENPCRYQPATTRAFPTTTDKNHTGRVLGGNSQEQDIEELSREKAAQKKWSEEVQEVFDKELRRAGTTLPPISRFFGTVQLPRNVD